MLTLIYEHGNWWLVKARKNNKIYTRCIYLHMIMVAKHYHCNNILKNGIACVCVCVWVGKRNVTCYITMILEINKDLHKWTIL